MSRESFSAFIQELNARIFTLIKSEEPHEKLGGIFAMDALVDVECEESPTFITRFANYLRYAARRQALCSTCGAASGRL